MERDAAIPVFVPLRQLSPERNILEFIVAELSSINKVIDRDFVLELIRRGDFVFLLDGYDEIPLADRDTVTEQLQSFISKADKNEYLITSRPDAALATFADFLQFKVRPLKIGEAHALLRKYDSNGETSRRLIDALQGDTLEAVRSFLQNPLLVSLLFRAFQFKASVPLKRHIFYRQVYDSLFESHDLTKEGAFVREKLSTLDIEEFHRVIRAFGFDSAKRGKVDFTRDELIEYLERARAQCQDLRFSVANLCKDMLLAVPLLQEDGQNYRWCHKAFQDYFAAQFICVDTKANQGKVLLRMCLSPNSTQYYNVLSLCAEVDYRSFKHSVVRNLLQAFVKYYNGAYRAERYPDIADVDLHDRRTIMFARRCVLFADTGPDNILDCDEFMKLVGLDEPVVSYERAMIMSRETHDIGVIEFAPVAMMRILMERSDTLVMWSAGMVSRLGLPDVHERNLLADVDLTAPMRVEDDPKARCNTPELFRDITKFVSMIPTLDYDRAVHSLVEIEAEIEMDQSASRLLEDL